MRAKHFCVFNKSKIFCKDIAIKMHLSPNVALLAVRFKAVVQLLLIHCLLCPVVCGGCVWSLFCNGVLNVLSTFSIISLRKR